MAEWLFTINDQIREREGASGVEAILSVLRAGAEVAPRTDVAGIESALKDAAERQQRPLATSEIHGMAGNLAVPDLTEVRVVDGAGNLIARIPVDNAPSEVHPDDRSENTHIEPEHPDRPLYS